VRPFRFAVQVTELPLEGWRERVAFYENLGFSAIHTPDHFNLRQWDPLSTQAAIAAVTTRAATGASVLDVAFYNPMVLARAAATIAQIGAGGYELGLGAGWMADDYEMAGMTFDRAGVRLDRLQEVVEIIRSLWTQEQTTYHGQHYQIEGAPAVLGVPLAVTPRILIGGAMPRAIGLAGAHADIVNVFPSLEGGKIGWAGWAEGSTIEHMAAKTGWARDGASRAGRDPDGLELSTQIAHTAVAEDPASVQAFVERQTEVPPPAQDASMIFLTGTPAAVRDRLQRRRDATGISYYVVFDPSFNYAHPDGGPTLPGDSGDGAGDRYFEAFARAIVEPLAGQ
jgi:probable F420-dependent oxidoreductase